MTVDAKEATRALNGWARSQGYADFETYIAAGCSFADAIADINRRRQRLDLAMVALYAWKPPAPPQHAHMTIGPEALARAEAEVSGDPVEPHNAHAQGGEHADA
jgi:hypothetical protein